MTKRAFTIPFHEFCREQREVEEAALCYDRASRALQPERQLSYQPSWQPSPQLQTDTRPMPGPAEPPTGPGSVYNSTPVTAVLEWPAPHPHLEWRIRQEVCPPSPCREKEQFRVGALASRKQHRAPGKRPAPPASACLSASAEAKRFVAESLKTQDTLENMTAEEAIEMAMPLVWRQKLQLATPSTALRARAETEGPTPVQIWNEGREQPHFADLRQEELGRLPTAEAPAAPQLQRTTAQQLQLTSAATPAPPAPIAAPPPMRWVIWMLPIGMPIGMPIDVPMPLLDNPPPLLPCQQRLPCPAAPPRATAAPPRAPELLIAAAALRSFVEQLLAAGLV